MKETVEAQGHKAMGYFLIIEVAVKMHCRFLWIER